MLDQNNLSKKVWWSGFSSLSAATVYGDVLLLLQASRAKILESSRKNIMVAIAQSGKPLARVIVYEETRTWTRPGMKSG